MIDYLQWLLMYYWHENRRDYFLLMEDLNDRDQQLRIVWNIFIKTKFHIFIQRNSFAYFLFVVLKINSRFSLSIVSWYTSIEYGKFLIRISKQSFLSLRENIGYGRKTKIFFKMIIQHSPLSYFLSFPVYYQQLDVFHNFVRFRMSIHRMLQLFLNHCSVFDAIFELNKESMKSNWNWMDYT
jgi:hypothetical protein